MRLMWPERERDFPARPTDPRNGPLQAHAPLHQFDIRKTDQPRRRSPYCTNFARMKALERYL
jgi:hypothetical protein